MPALRPILFLACLVAAVPAATATDVPAKPFTATMQHHRFFVEARTPEGKVLQLFTDSGGGMNFTTAGADKLGVAYDRDAKPGAQVLGETPWPRYVDDIPPPASTGADWRVPILAPALVSDMDFDGMLGAPWFGNRTWEWDYRVGTLRRLPDGRLPKADPAHVVKLGFQRGGDGAHTTHFPRIPARIDGQDLQFLFDTGATFRLDTAAAARLGDAGALQRAGNFVTASVFDRWRKAHPDWPYIEKGDAGAAMIQVPAVDVAGFRTGPAWFSVRPDKAFHEWMAQWMNRPVDGALGGETFRDFRITVDYPAETAVFER